MTTGTGRLVILLGILAGATMLVGCDWTFGGGVDSWNERWNWVNFSGVYRAPAGGVLVSDFTLARDTAGQTNVVSNERIAVGDGARTVFSGTLSRRPVVPGSVSIRAAGFTLTDDGNNNLAGDGKTGSIEYGTGAWSITLTPAAPDAGSPITASYQYGVPGRPAEERPGSTRISIHTFTVFQEGETLRVTDNNGAVYEGKMGSIRGSGGFQGVGTPVDGETIVAQYSVKGVSAAGFNVEIAGTFNAMIAGAEVGQYMLTDRRMFGTWIEAGGRTGDVNGQASPVRVTIPDTDETPADPDV